MPIVYPYTQYTGIWNLSAASKAIGAGTWPPLPSPKLLTWGRGSAGGLGLGNTTSYSSPKQVGSLSTWSKVTVNANGTYNFCISIKTDGTLWAWGSNVSGNLGLGNTTNYSSPKQVGALTNWSKVSSGDLFCIAVKTDGTLWGWGAGSNGPLGLGNQTSYSSPKQVGILTNWLNIACGASYTLAVKTDGTLWAWGRNNIGQLGTNNTTYRSSPVQVGVLTNWASVGASGSGSSYAITTTGALYSWGQNDAGQLGIGNTTYYSSPKQIGALTTWSVIDSGYANNALALKTDGTMWSWGANNLGQLGLGNTTYYSSPKQIGSLTTWSIIQCNGQCAAIKTDGTLWVWGVNSLGQLGLGNTTYYSSPKQVGALTTWTTVSCGQGVTAGIATV